MTNTLEGSTKRRTRDVERPYLRTSYEARLSLAYYKRRNQTETGNVIVSKQLDGAVARLLRRALSGRRSLSI